MYFPPWGPWWKGITGHAAELGGVTPHWCYYPPLCGPNFALFPLALMGIRQLFLEAKAQARALGKTEVDLGVISFLDHLSLTLLG